MRLLRKGPRLSRIVELQKYYMFVLQTASVKVYKWTYKIILVF